ncbi:MAG: hypothetical protein EHM32_03895, partial [Spirochaetales bacterium]
MPELCFGDSLPSRCCMLLGIDVGGTHTDVVVVDGKGVR